MKHFMALYFRQQKKRNLLLLLFCVLFGLIFLLYQLPPAALLYPFLLLALVWLVFTAAEIRGGYKRYALMRRAAETLEEEKGEREIRDWDILQELLEQQEREESWECGFYRDMISELLRERRRWLDITKAREQDMVDYYTTWVHQIKTPISAMRLALRQEDTENSRSLGGELQRIEQYVDMVLTYLRLGSGETDYVFTHVNLDRLLRECIKKYAGQFIRRHLTLDYQETDCLVLTDEKWLAFVVEQVLSNALKYTQAGSVSIYLEPPCTLCIRDTGIGIAPEDLPRIFERGYTGYNGRSDKKATGLGLYLCRQICDRLRHTITADSAAGEGTCVRIGLGREVLETE